MFTAAGLILGILSADVKAQIQVIDVTWGQGSTVYYADNGCSHGEVVPSGNLTPSAASKCNGQLSCSYNLVSDTDLDGDGIKGEFPADDPAYGCSKPLNNATYKCLSTGEIKTAPLSGLTLAMDCPAPPPAASIPGPDLIIGRAGEHGSSQGTTAMLFSDCQGGFALNTATIFAFASHEVAAGDVNKDGKDDIVVVGSDGATYVALGGFADGYQIGDLTPAGSFTNPNAVRVLTLDDVNNDDKLDIIVTMWPSLAVRLGNGDGTFGTSISSPLTNFDARGLAVGDLDGDGKKDAIANHAAGNWYLAFHKGNGDGTFANGVGIIGSDFSVPNIFIKDADGDLDLDVFSGSWDSSFKVWLNNGSGVLTETNVSFEAGGNLLVVDDLNGDGYNDAVTSHPTLQKVRVFLHDGSGGYLAPVDYGPVGSQPRQGVVADVNGDGIKDVAIVTVNIFDGDIDDSTDILLGTGGGAFAAPYSINVHRNNYTIAAGNFGGAGCVEEEAPDADGDTVPDADDDCSGTPTGEPVDANGCSASQRDTDNDGVKDNADACPGHDDAQDGDGDGIANGCDEDLDDGPLGDEDGDGVLNPADQCAGHDDHADGDGDGIADGCDANLNDGPLGDLDGDGVKNNADSCGGTLAGAAVDAAGCSGAQNVANACGTATSWKNHGQYVSCVSKSAEAQLNAGLLTGAEKDAIVSAAARSSTGKKK